VTYIYCLNIKARSTLATMSKQRSTLSKVRNFNANLVRHCCRFWQQSLTLLRHCCWCGPGLRLTERLRVVYGGFVVYSNLSVFSIVQTVSMVIGTRLVRRSAELPVTAVRAPAAPPVGDFATPISVSSINVCPLCDQLVTIE